METADISMLPSLDVSDERLFAESKIARDELAYALQQMQSAKPGSYEELMWARFARIGEESLLRIMREIDRRIA
jgi:hypothetical protein